MVVGSLLYSSVLVTALIAARLGLGASSRSR